MQSNKVSFSDKFAETPEDCRAKPPARPCLDANSAERPVPFPPRQGALRIRNDKSLLAGDAGAAQEQNNVVPARSRAIENRGYTNNPGAVTPYAFSESYDLHSLLPSSNLGDLSC
jgi:hypothetical protein